MLPSLTSVFIAGLFLGSQIPYFPLTVSCLLLFVAGGSVLLERLHHCSIRLATWLEDIAASRRNHAVLSPEQLSRWRNIQERSRRGKP